MKDKKQALFIQGGGDDGYKADAKMAAALEQALGEDYEVNYPRLKVDEAAPDFGWLWQIGSKIDKLKDGAILIAHSLGASLLLKYLSENTVSKKIAGIFLIAVPFWSGNEKWKEGLKLADDFAERLPKNIPVFFYHSQDDEEVPFAQLAAYEEKLPSAIYRKIETGGHQLTNNLHPIVRDIAQLLKKPFATLPKKEDED